MREDLLVRKTTRTAGAKRRGAEAVRQPVSAGVSSRRKTALAAPRHGAEQDAKTRHDVERHIRMVTDAVMRKLRVRQQPAPGRVPGRRRTRTSGPDQPASGRGCP